MHGAPGSGPRRVRIWQEEMAQAIRDPAVLVERLGLDPALLAGATPGHREFPVFVPEAYLARMRPGDPADPLLLQVLPRPEEVQEFPGFGTDPLEEARFRTAPALLQKYSGRALLVTTGVCAIHCRYCFRRHYPYQETAWREGLAHLLGDPEVEEALLSGGDPLAMAPAPFRELLTDLDRAPGLRRLRLHTRLPVVLPSRVDPELLELLTGLRLPLYLVLHVNHARELSPQVARAVADLRATGAVLLNQSVLLRGVNDSVPALENLSRGLLDLGILPYYLHLLDPVRGAAHFQVPSDEGQALVAELRARLPGYGVPALVREEPGASSKVPV